MFEKILILYWCIGILYLIRTNSITLKGGGVTARLLVIIVAVLMFGFFAFFWPFLMVSEKTKKND